MSCEKCWTDAGYIAASRMTSKADEYRTLITERDDNDNPCSPEEQCGDMHTIYHFKDGFHCMCGKVSE